MHKCTEIMHPIFKCLLCSIKHIIDTYTETQNKNLLKSIIVVPKPGVVLCRVAELSCHGTITHVMKPD